MAWDSKKYAGRKALSSIVGPTICLERPAVGSREWTVGDLLVVNAETGVVLATVPKFGFKDPHTGWDLRGDC